MTDVDPLGSGYLNTFGLRHESGILTGVDALCLGMQERGRKGKSEKG